MMVIQPSPEILEGTWEEIALHAPRFNGHRLRVTILTEVDSKWSESKDSEPALPKSAYASYVAAELAKQSNDPVPTPEEMAEGEREMQELIRNLNENRVREGAEPLL